MVTDLARKSLLGKARARPDQVRKVIQKMRQEGIFNTLTQVSAKLDEPIALGYSSAGIVLACGAGVQGFRPGNRVASNGPHAGIVSVPKHLCALVPEGVALEQAAFTVIASIALQGVRLARLGLGDSVLIVGLGLIGQIALKLLKAQGCRVMGTDLDAAKCELALQLGADRASPHLTADEIFQFTHGIGADGVVITAATNSDGPVTLAANAVRSKGRVVAIGAVGLNLPRQPFYLKEAEFVVSCSYGPGRYDPAYEQQGHDYPAGHVRWTENRNMQAILGLMASGQLDLTPLITHRFAAEAAQEAYRLIEEATTPYLGIVLEYPQVNVAQLKRRIEWRAKAPSGKIGIGCLGAGSFARMVLLPAMGRSRKLHPRILCSAGGLSAAASGERLGFDAVTADEEQVYSDPDVHAIFVLTRHNLHAAQVIKGLSAGKHVFVEKPLALTLEEVEEIDSALELAADCRPLLMVGFNRRFAPLTVAAKRFFAEVAQPLAVSIRFNSGLISPAHWTQDESVGGGRIIGEACHAIDLATFLVGSPPVRVFAESIGGPEAPPVTDDQCFITLRHENGAVSNIAYMAGGDASFSKERVEIFGGGRIAVIDNFRELVTSVGGRTKATKTRGQDKGHTAEIDAFVEAITGGGEAPIPWTDLRAVSLAAILAVRSIREGMPMEIPS